MQFAFIEGISCHFVFWFSFQKNKLNRRFKMKKITFRCFFVFLMVAIPSMAFADLIDLAPSMGSQWVAGTGTSRGIIFNANDDFSLNSVGIELNLSGTQNLTASLYAISGIATKGAQLASNSSQFTDIGRSWFDIPLSYDFEGIGNRYLLEISFGVAAQEAVFYNFQGYPSGPNPPYTVGPVSVFDGTLIWAPRIGNLAHFRMDIGTPPPIITTPDPPIGILINPEPSAPPPPANPQNSTSVPEPSTILLLCSGMIGLVGFRKKFLK